MIANITDENSSLEEHLKEKEDKIANMKQQHKLELKSVEQDKLSVKEVAKTAIAEKDSLREVVERIKQKNDVELKRYKGKYHKLKKKVKDKDAEIESMAKEKENREIAFLTEKETIIKRMDEEHTNVLNNTVQRWKNKYERATKEIRKLKERNQQRKLKSALQNMQKDHQKKTDTFFAQFQQHQNQWMENIRSLGNMMETMKHFAVEFDQKITEANQVCSINEDGDENENPDSTVDEMNDTIEDEEATNTPDTAHEMDTITDNNSDEGMEEDELNSNIGQDSDSDMSSQQDKEEREEEQRGQEQEKQIHSIFNRLCSLLQKNQEEEGQEDMSDQEEQMGEEEDEREEEEEDEQKDISNKEEEDGQEEEEQQQEKEEQEGMSEEEEEDEEEDNHANYTGRLSYSDTEDYSDVNDEDIDDRNTASENNHSAPSTPTDYRIPDFLDFLVNGSH